MQVLVYIFFIAFLIVLILLGSYFIISLIHEDYSQKMTDNLEMKVYNLILNIMNPKTKDVGDDIISLKKHFKEKRGVQAFYQAYLRYINTYGSSVDFKALVEAVVDHKTIINSDVVKKTYSKSYTLHLIAEFNLDNEDTTSFATDSLDSKSLYVRNNALRVIQNQKSVDCLLKAICRINTNPKIYNRRLVIDVLDNFKGPSNSLDMALVKKLDNYSVALVSIIAEHLSNVKNEQIIVKDKLLEILKNPNDSEVLIKTIRYFSRVYDLRSKPLIMDYLSSENWSVRVVSAHTLAFYADKEVVSKLKNRVKDVNYYVRKNSALSLIEILDKKELFELTRNINDTYASNSLIYAMELKNIEGYKEYLKTKEGK